jgi:hypothetical protein
LFVSYRREDSAGYARLLFDRLNMRFPGRVFLDVAAVEPGTDFVTAIERAVGESRVLVAVIGQHWLSSADASGCRRLDNPDDAVRLEITSALRQDLVVLPVLCRGASMPRSDTLPHDLRPLCRRQAISVREDHFDDDLNDLVGVVERLLGEEANRVTLSASPGQPGWMVNLDIADEHIEEIFYRVDDAPDFTSTGFFPWRDRTTRRPMPFPSFPLAGFAGDHTIAVKYRDLHGSEHGPFVLEFVAERELVRHVRHILGMLHGWISCHWRDGKLLAFFSAILCYKEAFRVIRYTVDDDPTARAIGFTADWTASGLPGIGDGDELYVELPGNATCITVRLTFIDGSEETKRFPVASTVAR